MIKTRPRRPLDVRAPALDAPLPFIVTCTGMRLPWPSGSPAALDTQDARPVALCASCGGYVDACQCDAPGTPPPDWEPDTENTADLFASDDFTTWPTLAERLAASIHDDRAA